MRNHCGRPTTGAARDTDDEDPNRKECRIMTALAQRHPRPTTKRRRRRIVASAVLLAIIGLLLGNTVMVDRQDAEAIRDSTLPVDGGDIHVNPAGAPAAPALVL